MLKVAHIVGSLKIGGAERFVIDLCLAQKNMGTKPAIISLGCPEDPLVEECKHHNIAVASYNGGSIIKLAQVFRVLLKFDVIHIHSPHALKFLRLILPFFNKKIIYTRHGAAPLKAEHWVKLHQKAANYIDVITFVSEEGLSNFQQQHHWQHKLSLVIDNGVIIEPVKKVPAQKLRLGSVGRMIPLKNQLGLLKAVSLLDQKIQTQLELNFFGDGECNQILQTFTRENLSGIEVNFHGMVSDRTIIYSNIDVLVVTSETEGLSMVIIEAMANYIPVIATNVGGNPKLVLANNTGWLFDFNDNQQLAQYLQTILEQRTLVTEYGERAFTYISDTFSIRSSAEKYAKLYEK